MRTSRQKFNNTHLLLNFFFSETGLYTLFPVIARTQLGRKIKKTEARGNEEQNLQPLKKNCRRPVLVVHAYTLEFLLTRACSDTHEQPFQTTSRSTTAAGIARRTPSRERTQRRLSCSAPINADNIVPTVVCTKFAVSLQRTQNTKTGALRPPSNSRGSSGEGSSEGADLWNLGPSRGSASDDELCAY